MTSLERRCRWLLLTYPAWYRRRRGEEMLGTLLETSPPGQYPQDCPNGPLAPQLSCPYGSPAVVSWGELAICAAWLVLGAVLTWILAAPAHRPDSRHELLVAG